MMMRRPTQAISADDGRCADDVASRAGADL